ncbi:MAG TPA: hypothetical protein VFU60_03000 [Ktedonobacterales bacterium]|nr:hypothetical protein [Ktedonobacterales bacterium]
MSDSGSSPSHGNQAGASGTTHTVHAFRSVRHTIAAWYRMDNAYNEDSMKAMSPINFVCVEVFFAAWPLILIEALAHFSDIVGAVLYALLIALFTLISFASFIREFGDELKGTNRAFILALTVRSLVINVAAYGELSRHLYLAFGGYHARQVGYWFWLRYGVAKFLDTILFGSVSIFGWHISDIHENAAWSKVLLLLFNLSIGVIILSAIVRQIKVIWEEPSDSHTQEPTNWYSHLVRSFYGIFGILGVSLIVVSAAILASGQEPSFLPGAITVVLALGITMGVWFGAANAAAARRFRNLTRYVSTIFILGSIIWSAYCSVLLEVWLSHWQQILRLLEKV